MQLKFPESASAQKKKICNKPLTRETVCSNLFTKALFVRFCEYTKTDDSEDNKVKHVKAVSMRGSAKATATEDFICAITAVFNSLLGFFGGSSPLLLFIEDKCTIPTPNTGGN